MQLIEDPFGPRKESMNIGTIGKLTLYMVTLPNLQTLPPFIKTPQAKNEQSCLHRQNSPTRGFHEAAAKEADTFNRQGPFKVCLCLLYQAPTVKVRHPVQTTAASSGEAADRTLAAHRCRWRQIDSDS